MNIQGQSQKYGHLIVAGGTIIALIGFLFLPYVTMSSTVASSSSSPFSSLGISSLPFTMSAIQAASYQGFTWLEALLAVGVLLVALLLAYSHNPFGMSQVALDKQVQRGVYTVIGISVVSLLLQYVLMTSIPGALVSMISTSTNAARATTLSSPSVAMGYNTGSWFYVVGMLAVIGGAIYVLMQMRPAQVSPSSSYMPPSQYSQNQQPPWQQPPSAPPTYQQPAQPQPTQGSQEQYPNQQQWQQPQPPTNYPPTQQAWQQPPPQQPQPPYPPSFPGQ